MNTKCPICKNSDCKVIYNNYPGYLEGSFYHIHKCSNCDSHFIVPEENVKRFYDIIYSSIHTYGYDRYYRYIRFVKESKDPLKFLANNESTYYPVYQYLKDKNKLSILEIGCGYGYLSYALHKKGFTVKAIDIASNAIKIARENFGDFFYNMDLKEFLNQTQQRFDLIIATELIEHIEKPDDFLSDCNMLLKDKGKIILTTPNKDYYKSNSIWQTDLPPVHIFWIGKKGIRILAEKQNLVASFSNFSSYYSKFENRLVCYVRSRKEKIGRSSLTEDGKPIQFPRPPLFEIIYLRVMNKISVLRFASNFIHNLINGTEYTLGVILEKSS